MDAANLRLSTEEMRLVMDPGRHFNEEFNPEEGGGDLRGVE